MIINRILNLKGKDFMNYYEVGKNVTKLFYSLKMA